MTSYIVYGMNTPF